MANTYFPDTEPNEFYIGDKIEWDIETFQNGFDITDFPSSSYTLTYYFWSSGTAVTSANAAANGTTYRMTILPATSNNYTAGFYKYKAQVYNAAGTEKYTVREGTFEILAKPSSMVATDARSHIKKVHELIKSLLEGRVTKEADSISIGGRSLTRIPIPELIKLERQYSYLVKNEEKQEKINKGIESGNKILVRF